MLLNRLQAPLITDFVIDKPLNPEVIESSSGARVHIFQNAIQPVVRVEFVFKAGKWYQPKPGIASLTAKMLKEGTTSKSAKQIADTIDFYGASLDISHGFDRSTLTIYCLSKFIWELIPLAFDVIKNPSFSFSEFEIVKKRVIQSLAIDKQKNSYVSSEEFTSTIYGRSHPYTTYINEEEIASITIEDLKTFHTNHYLLSESEVFITGDLESVHLQNIISLLSESPTSYSQLKNETTVKKVSSVEGKRKSLPSNNNMQAAVRVGQVTIEPNHQDYPALYLLNHLLGGYFGSRLMRNIREDKGFTYGIYSSLSVKENGTLFSIGTDIKGDKIEETLEEIKKELIDLSNDLIQEEELQIVKKHLSGKFISDTSTIFDKMDKYKSTVLLGVDSSFYTDLQARVKTIESEELKEVAASYFDYNKMTIVTVGGA